MHKCVLIAALLVASVSAFPGGAPPEACDAGVPSHGVAAQSTVCPYDFVALGWTAGEFSSMGVFPTDENSAIQFKGLLARVMLNGEIIGSMRLGDSSQNVPTSANLKLACDGKAVTHGDRVPKNEVFFEWQAPADLADDDIVELKLTVVNSFSEFWVDCNSVMLARQMPTEAPTAPTSSTSSSSSTTTAAPRTSRRTQPPTTRPPTQPPQTEPPTTRRPRTEPPITTPFVTNPPTTRRPRTEPPTTRQPNTRPPTTRQPRTRPPTTRRPRTEPPITTPFVTNPPRQTQPRRNEPPTTRRPRTRPPTTRRPRTEPPITTPFVTNPPRQTQPRSTRPTRRQTRRQTTTFAPTRRQTTTFGSSPKSSSRYAVDGYLLYSPKDLKHESVSDTTCREYNSVFRIVPNTGCREFTNQGYPLKCPGGLLFDPRVCSCAFTTFCPT